MSQISPPMYKCGKLVSIHLFTHLSGSHFSFFQKTREAKVYCSKRSNRTIDLTLMLTKTLQQLFEQCRTTTACFPPNWVKAFPIRAGGCSFPHKVALTLLGQL